MKSLRDLELTIAVWGALAFGALIASHSVLRPARDALVLDGNPDKIPWLFTATFIAMLIVSPLWSALVAPGRRRVFVPLSFHVFAFGALVFATLVAAEVSPIAVGRVFYVWSAVFNMFVVSVFWSLLADLIGANAARRLFGPIAAGGTVGALAGPALARLLASTIGVEGILIVSAGLLELAVIATIVIRRAGDKLAPEAPEPEPARSIPGAFAGLAQVARSPYLLAIAGYVLCTATAATFLYLEQAQITRAAFETRDERAAFFAWIDLWVSLGTLLLQTLVAGPLLRRFGPAIALAILPLAQLAGVSVVVLAPSLVGLVFAQAASRALTHGLTRPGRELLFTVVEPDAKYRAKNAIDTIGYRLGDVASAWLHAGLRAIGPGGIALVIAIVPVVAIWIGLAALLGAGFRKRVPPQPPSEAS